MPGGRRLHRLMRNVQRPIQQSCLDIDWVIGGCMSVDPTHNTDPFRGLRRRPVPHRQWATPERPSTLPSVDQCASGVGYVYTFQHGSRCVPITGGPRS